MENALHFNSSSYVLLDNSNAFNPGKDGDFTIEAWVNRRDHFTIFSKMSRDPNDSEQTYNMNGYRLFCYGNNVGFESMDRTNTNDLALPRAYLYTNPFNTEVPVLKSGENQHIAVVVRRAKCSIEIWVDGTLVARKENSKLAVLNFNNDASAYIGNYEESIRNSWIGSGMIDEFRYWNVARSPEEIVSNMHHRLTGRESGLITYFTFDQGTAAGNNQSISSVTDASTNSHNGKLYNFNLNGASSNFIASPFEIDSTTNPASYVVSAMGKRGLLVFDGAITSNPTKARLYLYGIRWKDSFGKYTLEGTWEDSYFTTNEISLEKAVQGITTSSYDHEGTIRLTFEDNNRIVKGAFKPSDYKWFLILGEQLNEDSVTKLPLSYFKTSGEKYTNVLVIDGQMSGSDGIYSRTSRSKTKYIPDVYRQATWSYLEDTKELKLYAFDKSADKMFRKGDSAETIGNYWKQWEIGSWSLLDYVSIGVPGGNWSIYPELFAQMAYEAMKKFQSEKVALKYSVHGTPTGIYEGKLEGNKAKQYFGSVVDLISAINSGKKIDFLDWSTTCNSSSKSNIMDAYEYANYMIASDFTMGSIHNPDGSSDFEKSPWFDGSVYSWDRYKPTKEYLTNLANEFKSGKWDEPSAKKYSLENNAVGQMSVFDFSKFGVIAKKAKLDTIRFTKLDDEKYHNHTWYRSLKEQIINDIAKTDFLSVEEFEQAWNAFQIVRVTNENTFTEAGRFWPYEDVNNGNELKRLPAHGVNNYI